jgi:hypothetical protein
MEPSDESPTAFVQAVADERRRHDAEVLLDLMARVTGEAPVLWGSIVGFGSYHYRYATGREGDAPVVGFSPRKAATTVYLLDGFEGREELLERLGPHSIGRSCLYLKRVEGERGVDLAVLEELVRRSYVEQTAR